MTEFPSGWRLSTVDQVGRVGLGRQRHPDWHDGPEMRSYLRVANVFEDRIDATDVKEMDFSGCFERFRLEPGDVLLNEGQTPELLGRPAIYRGTPANVAFTNTLIRFKAGPQVMPEWALIVFRRHMHFGRFTRESRITTNIAHLSANRFKSVEFPVPPLGEQRRIVGVVEDLLSRLDAAEANLATARLRSESLLTSALLGEVKVQTAPTRLLSELLAEPLTNGRSVPTRQGGFPVLRLTALRTGEVDLSQRKAGAWTAADAKPYLVRRGDFLVSRGNGSLRLVARGAYVTREPDAVAYPDTLIRVRARSEDMDPAFMTLVWNSPIVRSQIESMARTTAGIYKVNQKHLESIKLPVPSLDEQRVASARLGDLASTASRLGGEINLARERSRGLRRAVLSAAYAGRLTTRTSVVEMVEEMAGF